MATKIIRNTDNKPVYLHLPGGRTLKIPARGQAEVDEADAVSSEMALQQSRGNIILVEASLAGGGASTQEASQSEGSETKEASPQTAGAANDAEGGER
jgi:hypothetical protein